MQGKVLTFADTTGSGVIGGSDGRRYAFSSLQLRGDASRVFTGDEVDFETAGDNASEIYVTKRSNILRGNNSDKNRFVAAALAFFLGLFGAHKFYLGKNGAGVTMLIVSMVGWLFFGIPTFVIAIIALIEAIIYLTSDEDRFEAKYVQGNAKWF